MKKIQFLGLSPMDLEGFPEGKDRTFEGSLHLKPKKVFTLSDAEFDFVQKTRPDLKFLLFKDEGKKSEKAEEKVEEPALEMEESEKEE